MEGIEARCDTHAARNGSTRVFAYKDTGTPAEEHHME